MNETWQNPDDITLSAAKEKEIFEHGIKLFNSGKYYECHNVMEYLWGHGMNSRRSFYQGILQIAVALYHLKNSNARGAKSLFKSGILLLESSRPDRAGVDVDKLCEEASEILHFIESHRHLKGKTVTIKRKGKEK